MSSSISITTPAKGVIPDIPLELIDMIILQVGDDKDTIRSCTLVSHLWYPFAKQVLFQKIVVPVSSKTRFDGIIPEEAKCMLREQADAWIATLAQMPLSLRELCQSLRFQSTRILPSWLKTEDLSGLDPQVAIVTADQFQLGLPLLPRLRHIVCYGISILNHQITDEHERSSVSLESLEFHNCETAGYSIFWVTDLFHSVRKLVIDNLIFRGENLHGLLRDNTIPPLPPLPNIVKKIAIDQVSIVGYRLTPAPDPLLYKGLHAVLHPGTLHTLSLDAVDRDQEEGIGMILQYLPEVTSVTLFVGNLTAPSYGWTDIDTDGYSSPTGDWLSLNQCHMLQNLTIKTALSVRKDTYKYLQKAVSIIRYLPRSIVNVKIEIDPHLVFRQHLTRQLTNSNIGPLDSQLSNVSDYPYLSSFVIELREYPDKDLDRNATSCPELDYLGDVLVNLRAKGILKLVYIIPTKLLVEIRSL